MYDMELELKKNEAAFCKCSFDVKFQNTGTN